MKKIDKRLYTQAEFAKRFNINRQSLNQKIKNNNYSDLGIEVIQINGGVLIKK